MRNVARPFYSCLGKKSISKVSRALFQLLTGRKKETEVHMRGLTLLSNWRWMPTFKSRTIIFKFLLYEFNVIHNSFYFFKEPRALDINLKSAEPKLSSTKKENNGTTYRYTHHSVTLKADAYADA